MPSSHQAAFFALILCTFMYMVCDGCDPEQIVRGCRIETGQCLCATGCKSEYKYANRRECKEALSGNGRDSCAGSPCQNNGVCIQTMSARYRYKCKCEGTGFYGSRCQYACSALGYDPKKVLPYECIEI